MFITGNKYFIPTPLQLSGDRYTQTALVLEGSSWKSILSVSETTVADEKDYKCYVTYDKVGANGETVVLKTDSAKIYVIRE